MNYEKKYNLYKKKYLVTRCQLQLGSSYNKPNKQNKRNKQTSLATDDFTQIYMTHLAIESGLGMSSSGGLDGDAALLFAAIMVVAFAAYWSGSVVYNTLTRNPYCNDAKFLKGRVSIPLQLSYNSQLNNAHTLLKITPRYKLNYLSGSALKSKSSGFLKPTSNWDWCKYRLFNFFIDKMTNRIVCHYISANRQPGTNSWQEMLFLNDKVHTFILDEETPIIYEPGDQYFTLYGEKIKGIGLISKMRRYKNLSQLSSGKSYINVYPGDIDVWVTGLNGLKTASRIIKKGRSLPGWNQGGVINKNGVSLIPAAHNPFNWSLNLNKVL